MTCFNLPEICLQLPLPSTGRQSIDIVVAVHAIDVVIYRPSICFSFPGTCTHPDPVHGFLHLNIYSLYVTVPRGVHVLQLSGHQDLRRTAVNFPPEDIVIAINAPHFVVSRVDLLQSSIDLDPLPGARVWAPVDLVSRVYSPDVVDGSRDVFQTSGYTAKTGLWISLQIYNYSTPNRYIWTQF